MNNNIIDIAFFALLALGSLGFGAGIIYTASKLNLEAHGRRFNLEMIFPIWGILGLVVASIYGLCDQIQHNEETEFVEKINNVDCHGKNCDCLNNDTCSEKLHISSVCIIFSDGSYKEYKN